MKLSIVIPAYNEEYSIRSIIERTINSVDYIVTHSPVKSVEISVVSDGSTDKTVDIASEYSGRIKLIVFKKNRGYGAAIKKAWKETDADLLGFLDADGTCDPLFFSDLCLALEKEKADVALGSRINPNSKMPLIRKIGNILFAKIISIISMSTVHDIASGMRVVRRSSLPSLLPLPDGLHFTPAMSARAIMSGNLRIIELVMSYSERVGKSKLKVWKDGLKFLKVILQAVLLYKPDKLLKILALFLIIISLTLMLIPGFYYLNNYRLLEWMFYRFMIAHLTATISLFCFTSAHLIKRIVIITLTSHPWRVRNKSFQGRLFHHPFFWLIPSFFFFLGVVLVWPCFLELLLTGHTDEHWSRFVTMSFFFLTAAILAVTRVIDYAIDLISFRLYYYKRKQLSHER